MARGAIIEFGTADGVQMRGYLSCPAKGSGPGLILVHDMTGLDDFMRDMADRLAEEGYVCLAPDLYGRLEAGVGLDDSDASRAHAQSLRQHFDVELGLRDLASSIDALRTRAEHCGKLGMIGWGLGGLLATRAAARHAADCAVSYYAVDLDRYVDELQSLACPTLFHIGDSDTEVPEYSRQTLAAAVATQNHVELHVYHGCHHSFARPNHACYDKAAAMMAYSRTVALLRRELGPVYDLSRLWDAHTLHEFATRDVDATMATMVEQPYVNHIPTMTGGVGHDHLKRFYKYHFVNSNPPDTRLIPVSRTVGADRLVDEMVFCFTHTCEIPWMLPGVAPSGRYVEIPLVAIVNFRGDKLYHEHIYWDQASVLVQIGLLDATGLPVAGIATAKKLIDETLPSNELMADGWTQSEGLPV
jgi:carboxymethylenebutenolidase